MKPIKLESLKPHDRNPRRIMDKAFEKLCASIKRDPEFMPLRPICFVEGGTIIAGTQRYRACLHLGMTEVPAEWVRDVSHLGPEARRRFMILDNNPAGEWDWDILAADWDIPELDELGLSIPGVTDSGPEDEGCKCPTCGKKMKA